MAVKVHKPIFLKGRANIKFPLRYSSTLRHFYMSGQSSNISNIENIRGYGINWSNISDTVLLIQHGGNH